MMTEVHEPLMTRLPNGLRVISLRLPGSSTVGAVLSVNAGGADEPDAICGVSHFLEHLVFRATETYQNSAAVGAAIEGVGGYFNAFTSKTVTAYLAAAPLDHVDLAASIPLELATRPLLREDDIDDERPVVLREISLYDDRASSRAMQSLQNLVWKGSGYARPILGFPETLAACTEQTVRAYWRQHYRPDQAVFVVAGDVEHRAIHALVGRLVGTWNGKAPASSEAPDHEDMAAPLQQHNGQVHVESMDRQRVELWLGVRTPNFVTANRAELEALSALAGGGKGSRLTRALIQEQGLLLSAGAFSWLHRTDSMFAIAASAEPAKGVEAAHAVVREVLSLKDATDAECDRAIAFARGEYARSWAEPLDSATRIAEEALWVHDTPSRSADRAAFAALTPDVVRTAAARFLTADALRLAVVGPDVQPDQYGDAVAEKVRL